MARAPQMMNESRLDWAWRTAHEREIQAFFGEYPNPVGGYPLERAWREATIPERRAFAIRNSIFDHPYCPDGVKPTPEQKFREARRKGDRQNAIVMLVIIALFLGGLFLVQLIGDGFNG